MFTAILKPVIKKSYPPAKNNKTQEEIATHRRYARIHARKRAAERFGVTLSNKEVKKHERSIYMHYSELIGRIGYKRYNNYRELHIIKHIDKKTQNIFDLYAIYDYQLKCIVTYIPNIKNWPGIYV